LRLASGNPFDGEREYRDSKTTQQRPRARLKFDENEKQNHKENELEHGLDKIRFKRKPLRYIKQRVHVYQTEKPAGSESERYRRSPPENGKNNRNCRQGYNQCFSFWNRLISLNTEYMPLIIPINVKATTHHGELWNKLSRNKPISRPTTTENSNIIPKDAAEK
jgi:hypothetical protein